MHANRSRFSLPLGLAALCALLSAAPLTADAAAVNAASAVVPAEPLSASGAPEPSPAPADSVAPAEPMPAAAETAAAAAELTGKDAFVASHEFLVRGGSWRAVNPRHQSGHGGWAAWGSYFEWGLGRNIVRVRISGFAENGQETTFWEGVAGWHPGEGKIMIHNFGADGEVAHGEFRVIDAKRSDVWFEVVNKDGSSFELLDELTFVDDDHYNSVTKVLRDGEWVKVSEAAWERQKG